MFKTDSFLGYKKLSLNQNVWRDHATSLSTSVDNSEATWKKATKCNKHH